MLRSLRNIFKMTHPIISISTGRIRGKMGKSITNTDFYSFQGIPYAKPPVGPLRFKAPLPAESWSDIRDATHVGHDCIHVNPMVRDGTQGGEDCLTLNVYTPADISKNTKNLKPVMFWIHGGGFTYGSGSPFLYGPEFLLSEDIVLVTINYRIGILGFLSLEDADLDVPGNAGLKDMILALKWVQTNISNFSGDPNNVTIFGESAGGAATHYLILSPLAKNLFHKAILQSGCALNVWAKGRRISSEISKVLNLQTNNEKTILEKLQSLSVEDLFQAQTKLKDPFIASFIRPYGPVVEKTSPGAFLSQHPVDIIKSGRYNHVPMIIGYTNREGMLSEGFQKPKSFKPITNFEIAVPHFLKLETGSEISKTVAKRIKDFYYADEEPSEMNKDKFYLLESDNFFIRELLTTVNLHRETSSSDIFLYRMSVETELNMLKKVFGITEPGACHSDDLGYLFQNLLTPDVEPNSDEDIGRKRFIKLWTNFARNGDPNNENDSVINIKWKRVTKNELNFIDIGKNLSSGTNPEAERMRFWEMILNVNPVCKL